MKDSQFIARLKKALASMPKQRRNDILLEIQSHGEEITDGSSSLLERFGDPEQLAAEYLDGEPTRSVMGGKARVYGKRALISIGATVVVLVVAIVVVAQIFSQDDFDYANESVAELNDGRASWASIPVSGSFQLEIDQAKVALYWHEKMSVDWKCKGELSAEMVTSNAASIRHNDCLVFVPQQNVSMSLNQSSVVIVKPKNSLQVRLMQSSLRIAENDQRYAYAIEANRSEVAAFESDRSATVKISISADESSVSRYQY